MSELKVIKAYFPTFDADHNDMLLVSHTKENYMPAKQIECYLKPEVDKVIAEKDKEIAELKSDIRKLLIEYHKTLDSNESLRIAATESMRIVERKNTALMKCRRQIAHLNSLLSNTIMGKLKYNRQFGYWNDKILDEKFKEAEEY